jgi:hypothetical protein
MMAGLAVLAGGLCWITTATCDPVSGAFDFFRDDDYYDDYYYEDVYVVDYYDDCYFWDCY